MEFLTKNLIKINYYPDLIDNKFHKKYISMLMDKKMPLMDTIFYGASGSGKFSLFVGYLKHYFEDQKVLDLVPDTLEEKISTSGELKLEYVGYPLVNKYLVLINDSVNNDKTLKILEKYFEMSGNNINYILITHLERLKTSTLKFISQFIEKRKNKTYILATSNSINSLGTLKSYFASFRIERPSLADQVKYFHKIIPKKFNFSKDKLEKIITKTNRDLKISIVHINQRLLESIDPELKKKCLDPYELYLNYLLQTAILGDLSKLSIMRSMILTIYQSTLTWDQYIHKSLYLISKTKLSDEGLMDLNKKMADLDLIVARTKPDYCHYETLVFIIMDIFANYPINKKIKK